MPGVGQELLGLGDVAAALADRLVGGGEDGGEGRIIADVGPVAEQAPNQLLAVQAQRHGTAHALVVEGRHVVAHMHLGMGARFDAEDRDIGIAQ